MTADDMRTSNPSPRRWHLWVRDGSVAVLGAALGFLGVHLARGTAPVGPVRVAPPLAVATPEVAAPPARPEPPKAFVAAAPAPAAVPYRHLRRHGRRRTWPPAASGTALDDDYAADALVTRRLNEAALARLAERNGATPRAR